MRVLGLILLAILWVFVSLEGTVSHGDHPFSVIAIHRTVFAINDLAYIKASPPILGLKPKLVAVSNPIAFANPNAPVYPRLAQGKIWNEPKLVAVSNPIAFANPNAPVYPRLAQGKIWNEHMMKLRRICAMEAPTCAPYDDIYLYARLSLAMTVTWTSGYGINEAEPFVEWSPQGGRQRLSPAGTLTFDRNSMCGALLQATDGFSSTNLIGMGGFGSVYKGILDDGTIIVVKVLNLSHRGATKSFKAKCDALRNIRYQNLVKVLTACVGVDHQGNDFKALVYKFMANGSLE
ncbi:unnamed protein product [Ilex paraguariensis]|uniref:Protein kinase domain-containing protein n=1 Tax=Ilex paraguariensis TaxID=185542 RepID=A0ABC8UYN2_9AQUA